MASKARQARVLASAHFWLMIDARALLEVNSDGFRLRELSLKMELHGFAMCVLRW